MSIIKAREVKSLESKNNRPDRVKNLKKDIDKLKKRMKDKELHKKFESKVREAKNILNDLAKAKMR